MNDFPQIRDICIDDYVNEIKLSLDNKNYLSALSVALMIPDICKNVSNDEICYAEWFNKYVYEPFYNFPTIENIDKNNKAYQLYDIKLNGYVCYALRNAILHSGTSYVEFKKAGQKEKAKIDHIELCINGNSDLDKQYGESVSITRYNNEQKRISIRINIVNLILNILKGYNEFKKDNGDIRLFSMIDWDKKGGKIIFTPNK